jgi:hypothetical protein
VQAEQAEPEHTGSGKAETLKDVIDKVLEIIARGKSELRYGYRVQ